VRRNIFLIALLFAGCAPNLKLTDRPSRPVYNEPQLGGPELTELDKIVIREAFKVLPPAMVDAVDYVRVIQDKNHFRKSDQTVTIAGHHCKEFDNTICISWIWVMRWIIWHETAHVYAARLSEYHKMGEYYFSRDWRKIAGDVYGDNYRGDPESEGVLTAYGRTSWAEDVAEWVEYCYKYLHISKDDPVFQKPHLKTDERYRQKLALLRQYGFFSNSDYQKLTPLFQ